MIRALIVEDEENAITLLKSIINEYCPEIKVLGSTSAYQDSLQFINERSLAPSANLERLKQELFDLVSGTNKFISIPTNDGLHRIEINHSIRVEADRSYCTLHLINDQNLTVSKSLREIESLLIGNQFYRTHTSHLVNLEKVRQYSNEDGGCVILSSGDRVPISRRKKSHFLELIKS